MGGTISLLRNGMDQSFNIPQPPLTEKNLPDQDGKVFIITGSNTGVGYEVARILYSRHGTVYLACRTESKATAAIDKIKAASPTSRGKLTFLRLDLSDLSTIKSSASAFLAQESRLDWLDNNAGVMTPPRGSKSAQGHELQLATNVLGAFLFTKLLLPTLQATATARAAAGEPSAVRVSWAGSLGVDALSPRGGVQFDPATDAIVDHAGGSGQIAYGASKAANWFLACEFGARSTAAAPVLHNAYNPGNLSSDLQRHARVEFGALAVRLLEVLMLYPSVMGAYTELYAGLSPDLSIEAGDQGGYIVPWGRRTRWNRPDVVAEMKEGGNSARLWEWCERETSQYL